MTNPNKTAPQLAVDQSQGNAGLEGVIAAETRLSHVDGMAGRLILRGYDLDAVADWSFEALLALLWQDLAPENLDAAQIQTALGRRGCGLSIYSIPCSA